MGWFLEDHHGHEGYVVAVEKLSSGLFRELGAGCDGERVHDRERGHASGGISIRFFQVACDCGWRSTRYFAPTGARWFPFTCELDDEQLEDAARREWRAHVHAEVKRLADHREQASYAAVADRRGWARPVPSEDDRASLRLVERIETTGANPYDRERPREVSR